MSQGYVTVADIIAATGVRPDDFKLTDGDGGSPTADEKLEQLLDRWSTYVKGLIDDHCSGIDFLDEADGDLQKVPATVRSVAERALSRWITQVRSHRDSAMIRLDDWRVGIDLVDEVLPIHLRMDLDRHMRTRTRGPQQFGVRGFVAHGGS